MRIPRPLSLFLIASGVAVATLEPTPQPYVGAGPADPRTRAKVRARAAKASGAGPRWANALDPLRERARARPATFSLDPRWLVGTTAASAEIPEDLRLPLATRARGADGTPFADELHWRFAPHTRLRIDVGKNSLERFEQLDPATSIELIDDRTIYGLELTLSF